MVNATHNVIKNALVVTYGHDGYKEAFDRCQTSKRFCTLESLASHEGDEWFAVLVRFAAVVAKNPKTRAGI